jgi:post-segregation antitoxin (ccd killing protein)
MATRKITITLDENLVRAIEAAARDAGVPVSRLIASAAEREMRRTIGLAAVAEWEAEHGAFTADEIAAARAEMAAADHEYFSQGAGAA